MAAPHRPGKLAKPPATEFPDHHHGNRGQQVFRAHVEGSATREAGHQVTGQAGENAAHDIGGERTWSTGRPASRAARAFWPIAITARPNSVRCRITLITKVMTTPTRASTWIPDRIHVVKSASTGGGLIRRPRLYEIAADKNRKLEDSVAMIGGSATIGLARS